MHVHFQAVIFLNCDVAFLLCCLFTLILIGNSCIKLFHRGYINVHAARFSSVVEYFFIY